MIDDRFTKLLNAIESQQEYIKAVNAVVDRLSLYVGLLFILIIILYVDTYMT